MKTFKTMFWTELKLTFRHLDLPIFGIIFPVLVALVLGFVNGKEQPEKIAGVFASVSTIGIAANGLMGIPLTLAGYRHAKILKQLKVTPVSEGFVLFIHFAVKLTMSVVSAVLVWLILALFFDCHMAGNWLLFVLSYLLVAFAIFGIGMLIASVSPNLNTVNLLCSVVYFPMLFFSGATIPLNILPGFLVKIIQLFPLTQGIYLLETISAGNAVSQAFLPAAVMLGTGILSVIVSIKTFKWE